MMVTRRLFVESAAVAAAGSLLASTPAGAGWSAPESAFPELRAAGSPGDRGLAQGRAFASTIADNLAFYKQWLSQGGAASSDRLLELARGFLPILERHFPAMVEEMEGIARGAGLTLTEIALINARTDIAAIVEREVGLQTVPACTALAMFGERRRQSALALGQNWDWDPALADAPVVLRMEPDDGPPFVTLVEAGMLGKIGFNGHRVGVCLNFLSHRTDAGEVQVGVPIHCLLRAVLSCSSIDEAVRVVSDSPRCASANFLLAQHGPTGPRALDLEISPIAVATLEPEGPDLVHTNHFLDPHLAEGCTSGFGPSTMKRYARACDLAGALAEEPDPVRRMQRVLESREDLPYPISRDRNPDPSSSSLAGIVMDLTDNRFILTAGPPHRHRWIDHPGVA
jgi:isopenicillin-N N-acyltransferase-like protein